MTVALCSGSILLLKNAARPTSVKELLGEIAEDKAVRAAGGEWAGELKLWRIAYRHVEELGMQARIVTPVLED